MEDQLKDFQRQLQVVVYEIKSKFNEISSIARARIFYKGQNRNATYITEEFAEKLLATVPYTPVKGIWDETKADFLDHGESRTQGKIYGVVLAEPNFAWEDFIDKDGVTRTYACVDVLVYTEIYPEAKYIVGKSLSMELLPKTIKGKWEEIDGTQVFVFSEASFAGLQALGDDVEPCFEGAAFFELFNQMQELYSKIQQYNLKSGGKSMEINFKLSDSQKYDLIWKAVNPEYTEEGGWVCSTSVCDVYDDYALCYDYENKQYFRQYYTKNEDSITLGDKVNVYMIEVTESEMNALNALRALNGGNYEKIDENYTALKEQNEQFSATISERDASIEEYNTQITNLQNELETANNNLATTQADLEVANNSLNEVTAERDSLKDYQHTVETGNKKKIIEKYALKLDDEVVANYTAKIDEYTVESLEKDLSYELVKATPSIFSATEPTVLPKADTPLSGIEAILNQYK